MKKTITTIALAVFLLATASAAGLIAGENYSFSSEEFEYWTVVGNSSDMSGMDVSWENGNITITFDIAFESDNFTLIFFNENEIIVEVPAGCSNCGGNGGTRTVYRDRVVYEDRNVSTVVTEYVDREADTEASGEKESHEEPENRYRWTPWGILVALVIVSGGFFIWVWLRGREAG